MFDTNNTRLCEGLVISPIQAVQLAKVSSADANRRRSTNTDSQQNQGGAAQNLSMTQAETMMKNLVAEGWLEKSRKGNLSLTPRALMELRGWLRETYNYVNAEGHRVQKIKNCAACKDIITVVRVLLGVLKGLISDADLQGQRCGNRDCPGRLHDHCIRNFFRMQQAEKCPVCKEDWPGDQFVGERAVLAANRRQPSHATRPNEAPSIAPNGHTQGSEEGSQVDER